MAPDQQHPAPPGYQLLLSNARYREALHHMDPLLSASITFPCICFENNLNTTCYILSQYLDFVLQAACSGSCALFGFLIISGGRAR